MSKGWVGCTYVVFKEQDGAWAGHTVDDVEEGSRRDQGNYVGQCPHRDPANAYGAPTMWHALGTSDEHASRVPASVVNVLSGMLADQPPESPDMLI